MLIGAHAHLNLKAFKEDWEEIAKKALENKVFLINVGTNYENSEKAVEIAQKFKEGVYAAIGFHPINIRTCSLRSEFENLKKGFDYEKFKELARPANSGQTKSKVVAIGEIGLDYLDKRFREKQKEILFSQLKLAEELNLPIIFHCRKAHEDLIDILKSKIPALPAGRKNQKSKLEGVIHCFTGNWNQAKRYLEMGFYLGFNGIIFKLNLDEVIKKTPLDKILVETDCPFLTPPNFPEKRNNPLAIKLVAEKIAEIKKLSYEEIVKVTTKNAKKLFNL